MTHPKTSLPTHMTIGKLVDNYDEALSKDKTRQAHFKIKFSSDEKEDIMSYNDIINYMNQHTPSHYGSYWNYRKIIAHEYTPLSHTNYKGSSYNVCVLQLQSPPYNFKLKASTSINGAVHLGCAFYRDQHGILYMDPNQYIKQMEEAY